LPKMAIQTLWEKIQDGGHSQNSFSRQISSNLFN